MLLGLSIPLSIIFLAVTGYENPLREGGPLCPSSVMYRSVMPYSWKPKPRDARCPKEDLTLLYTAKGRVMYGY